MPFDPSLIQPATDRYRRERDRYIKLADRVAEICRESICEANAIRAQVTSRAKSVKSFQGKLKRWSTSESKCYGSVDDIFTSLGDLAGVRIATYRQEDIDVVTEQVVATFCGMNGDGVEVDKKDRSADGSGNYYRATHVQACLDPSELVGTYENLDDVSCEIQICTMMAHVWNEVEHDIGYKPENGRPGHSEKHQLKLLGRNTRQGDDIISELLFQHQERMKERTDEFQDVHDFVARMRRHYAVSDFSKNSGQLFDQLLLLDISTPQAIQRALGGEFAVPVIEEIETFNQYLSAKDIGDLSLDVASSDVLLFEFLKWHVQDILMSHKGKVGRGRGRPTRIYRLARSYEQYKEDSIQSEI